MSRILEIKFTANEEHVGGILADLAGRARSLDYNVVELRDGRARSRQPSKTKTKKVTRSSPEIVKRRLDKIIRLLRKRPLPAGQLHRLTKSNGGTFYGDLALLKKQKAIVKDASTGEWRINK